MLKKTMLLALAAGALIAFAAPAVAQAEDEWYTVGDPNPIGSTTETGDTVEVTGELASTKFPVRNGPCVVHATVKLWNPVGGTATGEVNSFTITATQANPCQVYVFNAGAGGYVAVPGCVITEATAEKFPWHIDVTPGTIIDITGANFKNTYNGCGALGIPNGAQIGAAGTATGTWGEGGCINFANAGDLKNPAEEEVLIDGSVCNENLGLE